MLNTNTHTKGKGQIFEANKSPSLFYHSFYKDREIEMHSAESTLHMADVLTCSTSNTQIKNDSSMNTEL